MRAIWLILSACIAIGLEAYGWYLLISDGNENVFLNFFYLHLVSSLIAAYGCIHTPITYNDHKAVWFGLFFVIIMFIPGFGLLGACSSMLHALLNPKNQRDFPWKNMPVPELPYKPVMVNEQPSYGEGGLSSVIQFASDTDRRVNAVIAAKKINEKIAIPLLQNALKDTEDDVRLLAYSVLDSKTTNITSRITNLLLEAESAEGLSQARVYYALAQNYWELSFLGLASGNALTFALIEAERFASQAAALGWSGSDIDFLIGRILLRQEKYDEAEKYFNSSLSNGALESAVLPFLAEVAYETHDFHVLRTTLERLNICCNGNTPIPAVMKSWSAAL